MKRWSERARVTVALPYIIPFYIVLHFLEDSGYLSRIAFLMDNAMHKIGLHGKAFIPMMLSARAKRLKGYPRVKTSLRFIQRLRNIMAHWELDERNSDLENIVMFTLVSKYRKITINSSLVEEYEKHEKFLLKKFG